MPERGRRHLAGISAAGKNAPTGVGIGGEEIRPGELVLACCEGRIVEHRDRDGVARAVVGRRQRWRGLFRSAEEAQGHRRDDAGRGREPLTIDAANIDRTGGAGAAVTRVERVLAVGRGCMTGHAIGVSAHLARSEHGGHAGVANAEALERGFSGSCVAAGPVDDRARSSNGRQMQHAFGARTRPRRDGARVELGSAKFHADVVAGAVSREPLPDPCVDREARAGGVNHEVVHLVVDRERELEHVLVGRRGPLEAKRRPVLRDQCIQRGFEQTRAARRVARSRELGWQIAGKRGVDDGRLGQIRERTGLSTAAGAPAERPIRASGSAPAASAHRVVVAGNPVVGGARGTTGSTDHHRKQEDRRTGASHHL